MGRILVVEDDVEIGDLLEEILAEHEVVRAYSGTEALMASKHAAPFDLVLLDLMLPGKRGQDILPDLLPTPVIVVSARPDPDEKADLIFRGASDYITKPFHPRELRARVAAILRPKSDTTDRVMFEDVLLTPEPRILTGPDEQVAHLTRTECAILRLLLSEPQRVFSRAHILDSISSDTPDCTESSLKIHISNLRRKMREIGCKASIESVWGIGYKMQSPADR